MCSPHLITSNFDYLPSKPYYIKSLYPHYIHIHIFNFLPSHHTFDRCEDDDKSFMPTFQVFKEKAKTLGIEFIPLKVSLKETVGNLKEKKFVDF